METQEESLPLEEFTPEKIKDFCEKKISWTREYQDLEVEEGYDDAGFAVDGKIRGFKWRVDWNDIHRRQAYHLCGLIEDEGNDFACWIRYQPEWSMYGFQESKNMSPTLLERDARKRIIFCGLHKDGVRHGLGSEFTYNNKGEIAELQGLWQNGKLTHRREGNQLVPVE